MNMSFAKTLVSLDNGEKTQTRRKYNKRTFLAWSNVFKRDTTNIAYDKNPRNGGCQIGIFVLTRPPRIQMKM